MEPAHLREVVDRLPGEPEDSEYLDDAEHWRFVLEQLIATMDEFLGRPPAHAREAEARRALEARREYLATRLAFWTNREQRLRVSE